LVAECDAFLWRYNQKLVIFDIDGTITRSDVVGYVETVFRGSFTYHHPGVSQFLSSLVEKDLAVVYLTSRPRALTTATRKFLRGVSEQGVRLPQGPLIMSSLQTLDAFYQEVVTKSSGVFKSRALEDVAELFFCSGAAFPPFIAGFGNRVTDAAAYTGVGINPLMVFLIDTSSVVRVWRPDGAYISATAAEFASLGKHATFLRTESTYSCVHLE
jgi:phosphatidate phosphatase LPIN